MGVACQYDRPRVLKPCTKVHSVGLRAELQQHPQQEVYRREYEESLMKLLDTALKEAEGSATYEKEKRKKMDIWWAPNERLCELCGIKYKLEKKDQLSFEGFGEAGYKEDDHPEGELHLSFLKARRKYDELVEKSKEWEAIDTNRKEEKTTENAKKGKEKRHKEADRRSRSRENRKEKEKSKNQ